MSFSYQSQKPKNGKQLHRQECGTGRKSLSLVSLIYDVVPQVLPERVAGEAVLVAHSRLKIGSTEIALLRPPLGLERAITII